jgi:hypothetical protein
MHKSQSLLYLTIALHVSAVTITHFQGHKTTVTTKSGNRYCAHTRTNLARESAWARFPMSQTRPCVDCHEPESTHACVVKYTRAWLPSQASRGGVASQTRTCMGTFYTVLLSAAIVEELKPVWVSHPQLTQTGFNSSTIAADNSTV